DPWLDQVLLLGIGTGSVHGVAVEDQRAAVPQPARVNAGIPVKGTGPGRLVGVDLVEVHLTSGRAWRGSPGAPAADLGAVDLRSCRHREACGADGDVFGTCDAAV